MIKKKIKWKGNRKFHRIFLRKGEKISRVVLIKKPDSICSRIYLSFFRSCKPHPYLKHWYVKKVNKSNTIFIV